MLTSATATRMIAVGTNAQIRILFLKLPRRDLVLEPSASIPRKLNPTDLPATGRGPALDLTALCRLIGITFNISMVISYHRFSILAMLSSSRQTLLLQHGDRAIIRTVPILLIYISHEWALSVTDVFPYRLLSDAEAAREHPVLGTISVLSSEKGGASSFLANPVFRPIRVPAPTAFA